MLFRIMPRQKVYFECFERCAKAGTEASTALLEMLGQTGDFAPFVTRIEAHEQAGDDATRDVVEALNKNLATPFDRTDIRALMEALDDILDGIDTVAHKLVMYRAKNVRGDALELARLLAMMTPMVHEAMTALPEAKTAEGVLEHCRTVHKLESEADKVLRRGIGALFDELKDPFELIKWKEILELLEHATDKCEDVITVVEEVVRKQRS